ncbi:ABC transporter ATP-binding protein [Halobacillus litoralis]|uniref:ABC transporter ATP-binding protein n=1 Tax=Halobacillus litoralis TaxID=45668 RepID=UPI002490D3E3|nr:ABC transporter ATP-binding protein [Halobacillus litoralis]
MSIMVNKVTKIYQKECALKDIDFQLNRGEIVGLVGPNGAGKTTLMKILAGVIVRYDGQSILPTSEKTGSLIEKPKYFPNRSGRYNLDYFRALYGTKKETVEEIINSLDLRSYLKKKVKQYSLGMKQRLGIALALVAEPAYLILDEPTNGMDPDGIRSILAYLKKLAKERKIGVLISSHILKDIEAISDRVYVIKNGRMISEYAPSTAKEQLIDMTFEDEHDLQEAVPLLRDFKGFTTHNSTAIFHYDGEMKPLLKQMGQMDIFPREVKRRSMTLEDFYFDNMEGETK